MKEIVYRTIVRLGICAYVMGSIQYYEKDVAEVQSAERKAARFCIKIISRQLTHIIKELGRDSLESRRKKARLNLN